MRSTETGYVQCGWTVEFSRCQHGSCGGAEADHEGVEEHFAGIEEHFAGEESASDDLHPEGWHR